MRSYSSEQLKKNEMGGACGTYGRKGRRLNSVFVGSPDGNRPLERPRRR
jgi:hypothetical protein